MATISANAFNDDAARTAGETTVVTSGAVYTVRTDSRIHANAPASFLGSQGSVSFTGIGGEYFIDATQVRWLAYDTGTGNSPAIGTTITQGGVSGYFLGVWASASSAPTASGAAMPATGFIKFREVTGGTFAAGALTGIDASATGPDRLGWLEMVWDAAANLTVPRVGTFKTRGGWFELGTTSGAIAQTFVIPTTSDVQTNNFCPGVWVEKYAGAGAALGDVDGYEFWPGLASAANGWSRANLGYAEGFRDNRAQFVRTFGGGQIRFGETSTAAATYTYATAQAGTYAGINISSTYTRTSNVVTVNTGATAHLFNDGQSVYHDFTSGTATDGTYVVTVLDAFNYTVPLVGADTSGNVTLRPGATVTFTAHGVNEGEDVYCDFTSGTGVDGTYKVYAVTGANTYLVAYPHTAELTSGNVSCRHTVTVTATAHGMAIGNEVYCDFTSGSAPDGRYIMKSAGTDSFTINVATAGSTGGNVTARWTIGTVPPTGCKVRISNILFSECATATRQTNSVPNATIASRPEFITTNAGAIDLESIYTLSGRAVFSQPYSVRLRNCAVSETLDISECATALDIDNVGVGMYSAQAAVTLNLVNNFAGGTISNVWAYRANVATSGYSCSISGCAGLTANNIYAGTIGYVRNTNSYAVYSINSKNITLNNVRMVNGGLYVSISSDIAINDLDYNDRFIGRTNGTSGISAATITSAANRVTVDGVTTGLGGTLDDCHPYAGFFSLGAAADLAIRNVGTPASYLRTGVWAPNLYAMGVAAVTGGGGARIKLQKWFIGKLRTGLFSTLNADKAITVEQVLSENPWIHSAKAARTEAIAWLVADMKGSTSGQPITAGQASVYGTHWYSMFQGGHRGFVTLAMNEPTAETSVYYTKVAGTVLFNSSGGVEMRAIGAEAIWEMPFFAQGHTAFLEAAPIQMTGGGTISNFTLTYQIDTGSGWNGTWKTLNGTNLAAETIGAAGFKLKIKIVTITVNTAAITALRVTTATTKAAQEAIDYPLSVNTITFNGLPTGCDVVVLTAGTDTILAQADEHPLSSYGFVYEGTPTVDVGFIKPGFVPFYIRGLSLGAVDTSIPVSLTPDRNFS